MGSASGSVVIRERIARSDLARLVREWFKDRVKYAVDIERGVIALGGEMHSDAVQALLEAGSNAEDCWGASYYPDRGPERCIEFTSLVNVRPANGNPGKEIQDEKVRERVRTLTLALIGAGESLD